ncbi:hypothetical protein N8I84_18395 [Streptomyces cynarae]|uniref:Uncharacterized protein n=1 Tax=Streptomyces cynarae TaxID=2981134 RepID=A0ABY6E1C5_9ACTN|nr:hypothetical protein [Streptomyces cynarae]UXY20470.1 hypothetical protein N8I84_18395 [Streptomyces cynarae]
MTAARRGPVREEAVDRPGARPVAIAWMALIRPARSAGRTPPTAVSASAASGTRTSTHSGTLSVPTWKTCAFTSSMGIASRFPTTTPTAQPTSAGISTSSVYETTTCTGLKPIALSTPIRVVPAITAPATTFTTISTEITSAITPNAMMNGTQGWIPPCSACRTSR